MPYFGPTLLDGKDYFGYICHMILSPKQKQEIYAPYVAAIQSVRTKKAMPQTDLSIATGLSSKYLTMIESGKRVPSLDCLVGLMAEAGCTRAKAEQLMADVLNRFHWKG